MIRDITIGQYYPSDSVIHRLDPRVKIIGTFVYLISLFCFSHFTGYLVAILFFAAMLKISRVPFRFVVKGLKPVIVLLLMTAVLNLFWTPGVPIFKWGFIAITKEGIHRTSFLSMRLVMLIIGSSMMTLTTTPNQLTAALEHLLGPLKKLHVPVHEISMMMSIALRFIPILLEETDKIMKAQMSRGADFESGRMWERLRKMLPLLLPLFISASRRANDLAYAMDARCYNGGEGRTKMKPLKYQKKDVLAYLVLVGYVLLLVGVNMLSQKLPI